MTCNKDRDDVRVIRRRYPDTPTLIKCGVVCRISYDAIVYTLVHITHRLVLHDMSVYGTPYPIMSHPIMLNPKGQQITYVYIYIYMCIYTYHL